MHPFTPLHIAVCIEVIQNPTNWSMAAEPSININICTANIDIDFDLTNCYKRCTSTDYSPFTLRPWVVFGRYKSVCLHAQLNRIKAIVRQCSAIGQLQLSANTVHGGELIHCTIGGAVPISTSDNRATGWPLYVTSNNKLRQHSTKMFSVDSCQFTSGPYHFSDAPLFRPLGRMRTPPAEQLEESAYDERSEQWSNGFIISENTPLVWPRRNEWIHWYWMIHSL